MADLPAEIIDCIVNEVLSDKYDLCWVGACRLVNKEWERHATPVLFQTVEFGRCGRRKGGGPKDRARWLLQHIDKRPSLAQCVREVIILQDDPEFDGGYSLCGDPPKKGQGLPALLPRFTRLRSITVQGRGQGGQDWKGSIMIKVNRDAILETLARPTVTNVTIENFTNFPLHELLRHGHIKHLKIDTVAPDRKVADKKTARFPESGGLQLKTLKLANEFNTCTKSVDFLTMAWTLSGRRQPLTEHLIASTTQSLEPVESEEVEGWIRGLRNGAGIREYSIRGGFRELEIEQPLFEAIKAFQNLTRLNSCRLWPRGPNPWNSVTDRPKVLPFLISALESSPLSNLQEVNLDITLPNEKREASDEAVHAEPWGQLDAALSSKANFRALCIRLAVVSYSKEDGDGDEWIRHLKEQMPYCAGKESTKISVGEVVWDNIYGRD